MSFLTNFWNKIVTIEKLIMSDVWPLILPALQRFETDAGQILLSEAVPICKALVLTMSGAGGGAKALAAAEAIGKEMLAKGIAVGKADINWAIETAVQNINAQSTATPTAK